MAPAERRGADAIHIFWPAAAAAAVAGLLAAGAMQRPRGAGSVIPVAVAVAVVGAVLTTVRVKRGSSSAALVPATHPRRYAARRGTPNTIDGDLSKDVWQRAPWSEPFVEIRGLRDAPAGTGPGTLQSTRMKMLWDDDFLYVAAVMDVTEGDEIVAKFTKRNSPIFHTDSDFEVFIDPAGCCHGYKELEMNALNTVWNLMLNRPYMDGGGEFSGRVASEGESKFWDVRAQRTAARVLRGSLHDASQPSQWCCEIALAHSDTLPGAPATADPPKVGGCWRINFSRVEKKGEVNWVWSPQEIWTPSLSRCEGKVNMHLPDAWGYVVFADESGKLTDGEHADGWHDPAWPVRFVAASIYYAVRDFKDATGGRLPVSLAELQEQVTLPSLCGLRALLKLASDETLGGYEAEVSDNEWAATINEKRLLRVRRL